MKKLLGLLLLALTLGLFVPVTEAAPKSRSANAVRVVKMHKKHRKHHKHRHHHHRHRTIVIIRR